MEDMCGTAPPPFSEGNQVALTPPTPPSGNNESDLDPSKDPRKNTEPAIRPVNERSVKALEKIRGEYASRSPGYVRPSKGQRGRHDQEWLTPKQRMWVELVTDFRATLYECARIAGYAEPGSTVATMQQNPHVMRAVLRRYHRRMLKLATALGPLPKFVKEVPRVKGRMVTLRLNPDGQGRSEVRVAVSERDIVDSILGEKSS